MLWTTLDTTINRRLFSSLIYTSIIHTWIILTILLASILMLPINSTSEQRDLLSERKVKIAFLYQFLKLVNWADDPATPGKDIKICIYDREEQLDLSILDDRTVLTRKVTIERIKTISDIENSKNCQLMYIYGEDSASLAQLDKFESRKGGLSVSDVEGSGIINFIVKDSKVRFVIDLNRAKAADVNISSRLLKVADRVIGSSSEGKES